jgi:hypothetical protein
MIQNFKDKLGSFYTWLQEPWKQEGRREYQPNFGGEIFGIDADGDGALDNNAILARETENKREKTSYITCEETTWKVAGDKGTFEGEDCDVIRCWEEKEGGDGEPICTPEVAWKKIFLGNFTPAQSIKKMSELESFEKEKMKEVTS